MTSLLLFLDLSPPRSQSRNKPGGRPALFAQCRASARGAIDRLPSLSARAEPDAGSDPALCALSDQRTALAAGRGGLAANRGDICAREFNLRRAFLPIPHLVALSTARRGRPLTGGSHPDSEPIALPISAGAARQKKHPRLPKDFSRRPRPSREKSWRKAPRSAQNRPMRRLTARAGNAD